MRTWRLRGLKPSAFGRGTSSPVGMTRRNVPRSW
jgi:hypothetical protein